jgi:hypothetical protein
MPFPMSAASGYLDKTLALLQFLRGSERPGIGLAAEICAAFIAQGGHNQVPPGDCVIELGGLECGTRPVSTVTGAMINMPRWRPRHASSRRGVQAL